MDRTQEALEQIAREDPELAARLFLQILPATAARLDGYDVEIDGLGTRHIGPNGHAEFTLRTDPEGIVALASGESALKLLATRRLHITGKRRKALKLRALADGDQPTID